MLQIAALPAQIAPAILPGIPAETGAQAGENGGFAHLMALLGAAPAPNPNPAPATPGPGVSLNAAPAAKAAASPAIPGKILPPVAAPIAVLAAGAATPGPDIAPETAALRLHTLPRPVPALMASLKAIHARAPDAAPDAEAVPDAETPPGAETAATPLAATGQTIVSTVTFALPVAAPVTPEAQALTAGPAPDPRALPRLIAAQEQGLPPRNAPEQPRTSAPADAAAATAAAAVPAEQVRLLPVEALAHDRGPAAAFTLVGNAPAPSAGAIHLRTQIAEANAASADPAAAAVPAADPLSLPFAAGVADPSAAAGAAPALAPPQTGHDFAALVDRLIAARDAAGPDAAPDAVNVAVRHAEFGQVSLQFRHDEGGLSVALSSADPGFAQAVQSALPAAAAAAAADAADSGTQPDAQQQAFARGDGAPTPQHGRGQAQQEQSAPRAPARMAGTRQQAATGEPDRSEAPARGRGRFA